jgi:hypothetical protein
MTAPSRWERDLADAPDLVDEAGQDGEVSPTARWEYLIVSLPEFPPPTHAPGSSEAVHLLNDEGSRGWEAVNMSALSGGTIAVLFKRLAGRR